MSRAPSGGTRDFLVTAGLTLASRLPFIGPGYGLDADAWRVAWSARTFATTGHYEVSRFPGYPLQELGCALLWRGGPYALCGATALLSALAAGFFCLCLRRLGSRHAVLAALAMASVPAIYIASVQALDLPWGLALALAALWLALDGRALAAGLLTGLAIGTRVTWILWLVPLAGALPAAGWHGGRGAARVRLVAGALIVGALSFALSFRIYGTGFLRFYQDHYPATLLVLKNLSVGLWGLPGTLALLVVLPVALLRRWHRDARDGLPGADTGLLLGVVGGMVLFLAAYLRLPWKALYLIPLAPLLLLVLNARLHHRAFVALCAALLISPWLLDLNMAGAGLESRGAIAFRLADCTGTLEPLRGPLLTDYVRRVAAMRYVDAVLARAGRMRGETVVVAGDWSPMLRVRLGGRVQGDVRYAPLMGTVELRALRARGVPVYYLRNAEWTNAQSPAGGDLVAGEARELDLAE